MHENYLDDIRRHSFSVNLATVKLTPTSNFAGAVEITGTGAIAIDAEGVQFEIVVSPSTPMRNYSQISSPFANLPGRYDLNAVANNGNQWLVRDIHFHEWIGTIHSHAFELEVTSPSTALQDIYQAQLLFGPVRSFPDTGFIWPSASITVSELEITFHYVRPELLLRVQVESKRPIDEVSLSRISESLYFVLSDSPNRLASILNNKQDITTKLRPPNRDQTAQPRPPLSPFHNSEDIWHLFEKYLGFILADRQSKFHPISRLVWSTIRSSSSLVDIDGLIIAVVVEGLLLSQLRPYGEASDRFKRDLGTVGRVLECLRISSRSRRRISGSLKSMEGPSATSALKTLVDMGMIDAELVKTWDKIRNSRAHGTFSGADNLLENYDLNLSVLQLLYHLVFLIIGYTGSYTDYSDSEKQKQFDKALPALAAKPS